MIKTTSKHSAEVKLESCKKTRQFAADTLQSALGELLHSHQPISEVLVRDRWLEKLRKNPYIFPDGWYMPPPHGIGVLIGTATKYGRHNYDTLRLQQSWPASNIFLNKDNPLMYVYASPVDRETGMIGDFGMTLYFGDNPDVVNHLKLCLQLDRELYNHIKIGMPFKEIYNYAQRLWHDYGFVNEIVSTSDPTGTNLGHTIPASYEDWTPHELNLLQQGNANYESLKNMISKKRKFINSIETLPVQAGMAFTNEARPTVKDHPDIPMVSFHTIIMVKPDGSMEFITQFEDIFKLVGMNYMLKN